MSDNAAEVEVLDDEASAFLTKDEIIGLIRALPDPLCGYSSWIFVGLCDIAEALLAGRDVVKTVSELEGSLSDEARQTAIAFTAVSAFVRRRSLLSGSTGRSTLPRNSTAPVTSDSRRTLISRRCLMTSMRPSWC